MIALPMIHVRERLAAVMAGTEKRSAKKDALLMPLKRGWQGLTRPGDR